MAKIYHPIPGLGSGRGSFQLSTRSRMYHGPDHLLIVQSTGYTEEYKRIFYRDIRYIEIRRNRNQLILAVISGAFLLLFLALYFLKLPVAVVAMFCLPFLIWFLINLFRGPTCECYVATSVQILKIPTPARVKKVPRLIGFLRDQAAAVAPAAAEQPAA